MSNRVESQSPNNNNNNNNNNRVGSNLKRSRRIRSLPFSLLLCLCLCNPTWSFSLDSTPSLPALHPLFSSTLLTHNFLTPTPIQLSSSHPSTSGHNLLLIAPTGSGKTLAYLLPALAQGTTLIMAPTRELATQLADTAELFREKVVRAIRGIPPPKDLNSAEVVVGTPEEILAVLTRIQGGSRFGSNLCALVLDEVDVLLSPTPKTIRTSLDGDKSREERMEMEQRRKKRAAQRRGMEFRDRDHVLSASERVLRIVATAGANPRLWAGSATASRGTLDRLNGALRGAGGRMKGNVKVCRVEGGSGREEHTIRAVVVPEVVDHCYVSMSREELGDAREVLGNLARVHGRLGKQTSLIFICGEFGRSVVKEPTTEGKRPLGGNGESVRVGLSVRSACSMLQSMGMDAMPMHVALGLEPNANNDDDTKGGSPPVLVTFEGSARGLHFDGVDVVYVVGRPGSAASYLHLAGRVGRAMPGENGVEIRPGMVVSFCNKGRAEELEKWTRQIGGTALQEIVL